MIIDENLLLAHGAQYIEYKANQTIFHEGSTPRLYYQIVEGIVELNIIRTRAGNLSKVFYHPDNALANLYCLLKSFIR